jgi:hypothetical protein
VDLKLQRGALWCGVVMLALFGVFFILVAGLVPPLSPTSNAQQITQFLIDNKLRVRLGIALTLLAAVLALPFLAVICLRVRRIEGQWGVLSVTQIFAGVIFVPGFLFPLMVLAAAAFRPERRPPEITLALDDVFWLMFVGIVGTLVIQAGVLAIASFVDRTDPPTFPRWFGYLNLWYAVLATPGGAVMIFNDGPLAWNGVFALVVVNLRSISAEQAPELAQTPSVA